MTNYTGLWKKSFRVSLTFILLMEAFSVPLSRADDGPAWNDANEGCCINAGAGCAIAVSATTYAVCPDSVSDADCPSRRRWYTNPDWNLSDAHEKAVAWKKYDRAGTISLLQQDIEKARGDNAGNLIEPYKSSYNNQMDALKASLGGDFRDFRDIDEDSDGVCASAIEAAMQTRKRIVDTYDSNKRMQDRLSGDLKLQNPAGNPNNLPVPDPEPSFSYRNANLLRTYDHKPMPGADVNQKARNYIAEQFERMVRIYIAGSAQLSRDFPAGDPIAPAVKGLYEGHRPDLLNSSVAGGVIYTNIDNDYSLCNPGSNHTTGGVANPSNRWFKNSGGSFAESVSGNVVSNHQCPSQAMSKNGKIDPVTRVPTTRGQIVHFYMNLMDTIKATILAGAIPSEKTLGVGLNFCAERAEKIKASRLVLHDELTNLRKGQSSSEFVECADQLDQAADGSVKMKSSTAEIGADKKMQGSSACNIAHLQNLVEAQMTLEYAYCVWYVVGSFGEQQLLDVARSSTMREVPKTRVLACTKPTELEMIQSEVANQKTSASTQQGGSPVKAAAGLLSLLMIPFDFAWGRRRKRLLVPMTILLVTLSITSSGCDVRDEPGINCNGDHAQAKEEEKDWWKVGIAYVLGGLGGVLIYELFKKRPPDHFDDFNGSCDEGCKPLQTGLDGQRALLGKSISDLRVQMATNSELGTKVEEMEKQLGTMTSTFSTSLQSCKDQTFTAHWCSRSAGKECHSDAHGANNEIRSTVCKCVTPTNPNGPTLPTNYGTGDPETQFKIGLPDTRALGTGRKPASNLAAGNSDYANNAPQTAAATAMGDKATSPDKASGAGSGMTDINPLTGAGTGMGAGAGMGAGGMGRLMGMGGPMNGIGMPLGSADMGKGSDMGAVGAAGMAMVKYGQGGADSSFGGSAIEAAALKGDGSQGSLGKDLFGSGNGKDGKDGKGLGKSGLKSMGTDDPDDYFTRIGRDESIFRRASKRYSSTTIDWMKDDVTKGRSPMSEQIQIAPEDKALFEEIRRHSEKKL